jgi:hypothetical protein
MTDYSADKSAAADELFIRNVGRDRDPMSLTEPSAAEGGYRVGRACGNRLLASSLV